MTFRIRTVATRGQVLHISATSKQHVFGKKPVAPLLGKHLMSRLTPFLLTSVCSAVCVARKIGKSFNTHMAGHSTAAAASGVEAKAKQD